MELETLSLLLGVILIKADRAHHIGGGLYLVLMTLTVLT